MSETLPSWPTWPDWDPVKMRDALAERIEERVRPIGMNASSGSVTPRVVEAALADTGLLLIPDHYAEGKDAYRREPPA